MAPIWISETDTNEVAMKADANASPIFSALDKLEEALRLIGERTDILRSTLGPILSEANPEPSDNQVRAMQPCVVLNRIDELTGEAERLGMAITNILGRVAI